jgi:hypothetical protein
MGFEEDIRKILEQNWEQGEKELIERTIVNILSYKIMMSKALKEDIILIVDLCIKLKKEINEKQDKTD